MGQLIIATEKKLSRHLLISERRVRELFKEFKYAPGQYDYLKCVKKYIEQMKSDTGEFITQKSLSEILSLTEKRVRNLTEQKILISNENNKYHLKTNVQNYINKKVNEITDKKNEENNKLKAIQRETQEFKLKILRDEFYPDDVVRGTLSDMLIKFKSQLLSTSRKITIEIEQGEKPDIKKIVEKHVLKTLEELEKYDPPSNKGDK